MSPRYITVCYQQSQITNNFYNFIEILKDQRRGGGKQKETEKELK